MTINGLDLFSGVPILVGNNASDQGGRDMLGIKSKPYLVWNSLLIAIRHFAEIQAYGQYPKLDFLRRIGKPSGHQDDVNKTVSNFRLARFLKVPFEFNGTQPSFLGSFRRTLSDFPLRSLLSIRQNSADVRHLNDSANQTFYHTDDKTLNSYRLNVFDSSKIYRESSQEKHEFFQGQQLPNHVGGQLNPTWTEWLMGYPAGWSELNALVTPWFRSRRKQRSKS